MDLKNIVPDKYYSSEIKSINSINSTYNYKINISNLKFESSPNVIRYHMHDNYHTFNINIYKNAILYYIYVLLGTEEECVSVIISKKDKICVLHHMVYIDGRVIDGLCVPGIGSKLFPFSLDLLSLYNRGKFTKLLLTDTSLLYCDMSNGIIYSNLKLMLDRQTFYQSHGFVLLDHTDNKKIEENNNIIDTILTSYILLGIKLKIDLNTYIYYTLKYPYIRDFVRYLYQNSNRNKEILYKIIDYMYIKYKLTNMSGMRYVLTY
jgi:hypothetical protein